MESFTISVRDGQDSHLFEVRDYIHTEENSRQCKFEIFEGNRFVLSLEPDGQFLRECKNPGLLDDELIHKIIERVSAHHV